MSRSILCTSSSGLDNLNIRHDIGIIRLRIHINNVEFIDGKNIATEKVGNLMDMEDTSGVFTSPSPAEEVRGKFEALKRQRYKEVFVVCLSSRLSESYGIISKVAAEFKYDMDIFVYDCRELNICEAFLALEAAELTKLGMSMPDIAKRLDVLRACHKMQFAIQDISYLIKNKKISNTAGFIANLFNIKLIIKINDEGEVVPARKIRHFSRAIEHLLNQYDEISQREDLFTYILSSGKTILDTHFLKLLKETRGVDNIPILPASAISIANHGPTGIGLCYFEGEIPMSTKLLQTFDIPTFDKTSET